DIIVAPSRYSANSYTEPELRAKVRLNPLGGNFPIAPLRPETRENIVLSIGNSFLRKGFAYLLSGFRQWRHQGWRLVIRGDVPPAFQDSADRSGTVEFLAPVLPARLRALYARARVFCLPSIDEGFGMVALEALAYGLPLI